MVAGDDENTLPAGTVNDIQFSSSPAPDTPPALFYANLGEFVEKFLTVVYRRHTDAATRCWCPHWWLHAEALVGLDALWRSWEAARLDPANGIAVWMRDLFYPTMTALMDPAGTFAGCSIQEGHNPRKSRLLTDPPPPDFWDLYAPPVQPQPPGQNR